MITHTTKIYPTIGCCGLDCGLCPRYYTKGPSRCPGCCGPNFWQKHPGCSIITCCVKKRNLEVCTECPEFPCSKFKETGKYDSFLTHKKIMPNLSFIKEYGIKEFIKQQEKRIKLLKIMLKAFDDGRSKSFYCISSTLLAISDIEKSLKSSKQKVKKEKISQVDIKTSSKILKGFLNNFANKHGIELRLRKK